MTRRRRLVFGYAAAAVAAAVLPLAGLLELSYRQTAARIDADMTALAAATADRADAIFAATEKNLKQLDAVTAARPDAATAREMTERVFTSVYVRGLWLAVGGKLVASDLGVTTPPVAIPAAWDGPTPAVGQTLVWPPTATLRPGKSVVVAYRPRADVTWFALIDPDVFVEFHPFTRVGEESGVFLFADDGRAIVGFGDMPAAELPVIRDTNPRVQHAGAKSFAVHHAAGVPAFVVVAASDDFTLRQWRRTAALFAFIGAVVAIGLVFGVFRLARRAFTLEAELRDALAGGTLAVHYQPVVAADTGACRGAEALVRWPHPARGWVPPAVCVPVAEQAGLTRPLTVYVFARVARDMAGWLDVNPAAKISVNVTADGFRGGWIAAEVAAAFTGKIRPGQLVLELTESGHLDPADATTRAEFDSLRADGYRFAADDFGTGYSNITLLRQFPFDYLKIDRSFVSGAGAGPGPNFVEPILAIAAAVGLKTVAEGVETADQLDYLRRVGVASVQGWYFSPAVPAEKFREFAARPPADAAG